VRNPVTDEINDKQDSRKEQHINPTIYQPSQRAEPLRQSSDLTIQQCINKRGKEEENKQTVQKP